MRLPETKDRLPWINERMIYLAITGSHAYGTSVPSSDLDLKGVAIPPKEYFLGFLHRFEQATYDQPDATIMDIRKFIKLASDANPSVLEILFVDEEDQRVVTPAGRVLLDHRDHFLSTKVRYSFMGYAMSQLKRIKADRDKQNPKHAMHFVRLCRMGQEILRGEGVIVKRPDAEELLSIRQGNYNHAELVEWGEAQEEEFNRLYKSSRLPKVPNRKLLDKICVQLVEEAL